MNTSVKKAYYTIPVLYVVIISLLLYGGLNHGSDSFLIKRGPVTVSGIGLEGLSKNSLKSFTIDIPGLKLNLFKNPLYLIDTEGNRKYIRITGFSFEDARLIVSFTDSARLTFIFDPQTDSREILSASFSISGDASDYRSVYIPAEAGYTMEQLSFLPSYVFNDRGSKKLYIFNTGSGFDITAGVLTLSLKQNRTYFSLADIGDSDPLSFYFFGSGGPENGSTYEAVVEDFIRKGYTGWKSGRFNDQKGEWFQAEGSASFNNEIVTAFIAESLKRGRYSDINKLLSSVTKHSEDFTYLCAPFTGNIVDTDVSRQAADDLLKKKISSAESKEDIFLYNHLIEELNWISSSALYRTFNTLVSSFDLSGPISPEILTGMLEVYRDVVKGDSDQYHDVLKLYSIIESQLYPCLIHTGDGLFLQNKDGSLDISLSIRAGLALYDIGQMDNDTLMSSVGRTLVVSSLNLQSDDGLLPTYLNRDGSISGKNSFFGAELFYPSMTDNEYYPHIVNFNFGTSREIRIWTAAKDISFSKNNNTYTFDITFPRGVSHHLVIKGVPPFKTLKMHGIPWNSDRRFQYYTSGWVYDERTKTLYMKLSQRKNKERIVLLFSD